MISATDTIKQSYEGSTTQYDKIVLDEQEYPISNVELDDDCYENGNIFGTAIAKALSFEIDNSVNLEGKEFKYYTGIKTTTGVEWIKLGTFITQDVEPNDTTKINIVNAIDYMLKSNIVYKSNLDYSSGTITMLQVLQEICQNSGLELATTDFANADFIVDSNQFEQGTLNRQVIQAIAQMSGTVAKVRSDDKLYLITPKITGTVRKVFNLSDYSEMEIKRATHPINLVSLGMSDVEGENVVMRDETSIEENGENSLVFNDNPFAYTEAKRQQLITAIFNAVKGFEYKAFTLRGQYLPYLETLDNIQIKDLEGNIYNSFLFRVYGKSPNGLETEMSAPSITDATVKYQNVATAEQLAKKTELKVDKQNQTIQGVIENVTAQNNKISQITQTVNELNSKISDIADITVSKESLNGTVTFEDVNQSEPIYINIYPRGENISYLYPSIGLFPSETLYLKVRTLRFTNTTTNECIDYELPTDLLYYDAENYDEFILDYNTQTCVVNKKVGYNADGTTYLLETPTTIEYDFPNIQLTDGDYTITLLGYNNAYMFIRLMSQNIYTTQFATKAELNSEISQTESSINTSVEKKLLNYTETIKLGTFIEQNWEYIKVAWNQISQFLKLEGIDGKATLNIYNENNVLLMTLNQDGLTFYDESKKVLGSIGVIREDTQDTLAFVMPVDWENVDSNRSMAWGITDPNGQFLPIFYLAGYYGDNSSDYGGKVVVEGNLSVDTLELIKNTITSGDTSINIIDLNGNVLLSIDSNTPLFNLCNLIYSNIDTDGSLRINFSDCRLYNMKNVATTDENLNYISGSADSHIFASFKNGGSVIIFENSSDKNLKKNIKETSKKALDKIRMINHKEFDWKANNKHQDIGYIAQEMKQIDDNFVHYTKYTLNGEEKENWQINTLSVLATATKAIQEQQEQIEQLQKEILKLKGEKEDEQS